MSIGARKGGRIDLFQLPVRLGSIFAMARPIRKLLDGGLYHVLNRGNARSRVFHKDEDFLAFLRVLQEGLAKFDVELLCWCVMNNHWHLVLRPRCGPDLSRVMQWVAVTHARRRHAHYRSRGGGHLYQGRFKSFPVQDDRHFLTLCRYVEANPRRAKLLRRAEDWRWSSLGYGADEAIALPLAPWPVERPRGWAKIVNAALDDGDEQRLKASLLRGAPFGDDRWTLRVAQRSGLGGKLKPIGRPRTTATGAKPAK